MIAMGRTIPMAVALAVLELAAAQDWTDRWYKPSNSICIAAGDVHMAGFNTAAYDMQSEGLYDLVQFDPAFSSEAVQVHAICFVRKSLSA
jgi:hypothetical protein